MSSAFDQGSGEGHVPPPPQTAQQREDYYVTVQQSEEFQDLRRRFRGFVLPVTGGALLWYFSYVLLAAYAPGFMGRPVIGNINIGLILGLLQFVTTFAITALYIRFAERALDPASSRIREHMEKGGLR
jgi:uncharacterized membrane protein (DUF485 family)